jgi:hypothetical protein
MKRFKNNWQRYRTPNAQRKANGTDPKSKELNIVALDQGEQASDAERG